eukprot:1794671-Rhodomonas_salina.2
MLDDNTIGEQVCLDAAATGCRVLTQRPGLQGTPSRQAASAMRFDPLASGPKEGLESKLQVASLISLLALQELLRADLAYAGPS